MASLWFGLEAGFFRIIRSGLRLWLGSVAGSILNRLFFIRTSEICSSCDARTLSVHAQLAGFGLSGFLPVIAQLTLGFCVLPSLSVAESIRKTRFLALNNRCALHSIVCRYPCSFPMTTRIRLFAIPA